MALSGSSSTTSRAALVALAPMSGVTDLPFRKVAHRLGTPIVVSEMIASEELVKQRADVLRRAEGRDLTPFVIQLAGREAHWMAEGAKIAEGRGADQIDINMGCPAKEVTGKLSGSALMRNLDHAQALIKAVVSAVRIPVTLKMRLGWDQHTLNAPDLARRAEAEGVVRLTVHGRTRCQFFTGSADWKAVHPVVDATTLPVLVNGDILTIKDAVRAMAESGAAGVMIGRGAYGAPWLPARVARFLETGADPGAITLAAQRDIALSHVSDMYAHYGTPLGLKNARKHIGWYLASSGATPSVVKMWRARLCTQEDTGNVLHGLAEFYDRLASADAEGKAA